MQPPFTLEQKLDLPAAGSEGWGEEYLSRCSVGKMFTVKGIRGEECESVKVGEGIDSIDHYPCGSGLWLPHH